MTHPMPIMLGLLAAMPALAATRPVDETRAVNPAGSIRIVNTAGSVEVRGWDRPELKITGTLGDQVQRLDITTHGEHTTIKVVLPASVQGDGAANLLIQLPAHNAVSALLVSAGLKIAGVQGATDLRSVSGDISGVTGSDARVETVSGRVRLSAPASVTRHELRSVSGPLSLDFDAVPAADFDIGTLSGAIDNCFGPRPQGPAHGPGAHLEFTTGAGAGHVQLESVSGDVRVCAPAAAAR